MTAIDGIERPKNDYGDCYQYYRSQDKVEPTHT